MHSDVSMNSSVSYCACLQHVYDILLWRAKRCCLRLQNYDLQAVQKNSAQIRLGADHAMRKIAAGFTDRTHVAISHVTWAYG